LRGKSAGAPGAFGKNKNMNFEKELRVGKHGLRDQDSVDPGARFGFTKETAAPKIAANRDRLDLWQERLYAESAQSLLIVLQGMDTAGKDGAIRHVMSGFSPAGCAVTSFKAPNAEELAHDFLWRVHKATPRQGDIAIFNRSHYEDVLIVRVKNLVPKSIWRPRYDRINDFEKLVSDRRTRIVKFFLHISKDEQGKRLQARLDDPQKRWKFNEGDLRERAYWAGYQRAYRDALRQCSTPHAPWYVIPADHKWFRNLAISEVLVSVLKDMRPAYPPPAPSIRRLRVR
jgi:PPK2 family polyphosphate:nucleotide phosphotransferase